MKALTDNIVYFLQKQGFVIVSTLDSAGGIHCAAKGIVGIEKKGRVYIIDLYRGTTFNNLKNNPTISITAVDEHKFIGYTLKGKAGIVQRGEIKQHLVKKWEERVIQRISQRVIKNVRQSKKSFHHPEAHFPVPQYLIEVGVEEIIDLTPQQLKKLQQIDSF